MASVEFIQKRLESKKVEITKLQQKLNRIKKAQATSWVNNPYYYSESDLRSTQKELEQAQDTVTRWEQELTIAQSKDASRNVQVILDFLDNWKKKSLEWYNQVFQTYLIEKAEWIAFDTAYCEWHNNGGWRYGREVVEDRRKEYTLKERQFNQKWAFIQGYISYENRQVILNKAKLQKDLDEEAKRKYDFIIERTNEIVGQITDASNLKIGNTGELNGYIIGTDGKAKVETIGAGGYNEDVIVNVKHGQRFHFRTLINPLK